MAVSAGLPIESRSTGIAQASRQQQLDASKLTKTYATVLRSVPKHGSAEFWAQNVCSDHMVTCRWTAAEGWGPPELKPYGNFSISPIASCLHYATQCFEGLKAYRGFDGKLRLFRPILNARRLALSAERVALPGFDAEELVKLIEALLHADGPKWLPESEPGRFLYLRPAMIGDGDQIGVQLPRVATLFIVAIPWPDFSTEVPPGVPPRPLGLRLLASSEDTVRAWPGGFGHAKVGANYGTTFTAHGQALRQGFDQILWLLGSDFQVTEAGASNFFIVVKNSETQQLELVTASLDGKIILDGVTRRSVLDLARDRLNKELIVVERDFTMFELEKAWHEGRLVEAFVSGTAFFITPVAMIHFQGRNLVLERECDDRSTKFAAVIKNMLHRIMYGEEEHEWSRVIAG